VTKARLSNGLFFAVLYALFEHNLAKGQSRWRSAAALPLKLPNYQQDFIRTQPGQRTEPLALSRSFTIKAAKLLARLYPASLFQQSCFSSTLATN